jgi:hypothetical protein
VWHVARVEAGKEPAFVTDLLRYGLPFFMPWHTIKKKYQNRLTRVSQQAAFKGYCFISGDEAIDLAHDRCRGYLTFMQDLRGEAMQASIRRDVFNLYRLLLNDSVLTPEEFARGTLVRVKDRKHALFGVIGRVTEHEAGKRLTIDVEIFGQSVSTEIEDELAVEIVLFPVDHTEATELRFVLFPVDHTEATERTLARGTEITEADALAGCIDNFAEQFHGQHAGVKVDAERDSPVIERRTVTQDATTS